jgi:hypothetical protein
MERRNVSADANEMPMDMQFHPHMVRTFTPAIMHRRSLSQN